MRERLLRLLVVAALALLGGPAPSVAAEVICGHAGFVSYDFETGAPGPAAPDRCDHCLLAKLAALPPPAPEAPLRAAGAARGAPAPDRAAAGLSALPFRARGPPAPA